jgi:hypothetical protein
MILPDEIIVISILYWDDGEVESFDEPGEESVVQIAGESITS